MAITNAGVHPKPTLGRPPSTALGIGLDIIKASVAGLKMETYHGNGPVKQTYFEMSAMPVGVTETGGTTTGWGTLLIATFPEGRTRVLDCVCNFTSILTTSAPTTTLNDGKTVSIGIGSVATVSGDSGVLSGTMMNFMPGSGESVKTFVSSGTTGATATGFLAPISAAIIAAILDGTSTASSIILNIGVPTGDDIDADATLAITGTILITWMNTGDY